MVSSWSAFPWTPSKGRSCPSTTASPRAATLDPSFSRFFLFLTMNDMHIFFILYVSLCNMRYFLYFHTCRLVQPSSASCTWCTRSWTWASRSCTCLRNTTSATPLIGSSWTFSFRSSPSSSCILSTSTQTWGHKVFKSINFDFFLKCSSALL